MRTWVVIWLVLAAAAVSSPVAGQSTEQLIHENPFLVDPDDVSDKSTDPVVLRARIKSLGKVITELRIELVTERGRVNALEYRIDRLEKLLIEIHKPIEDREPPKPRPKERDLSPARSSTRYGRTEQIRKGILDRMGRGDANYGFTSEEWAAIHLSEEEFAEEYGDGPDGVN